MTAARKKKSKLPAIIGFTVLAVAAIALLVLFGPNLRRTRYFYVHTGATYDQVLATLRDSGYVRDVKSFDAIARAAKLPEHIHPGKYELKGGMSNYAIIRLLHSGKQTPVKLVINKVRTRHDFIALVSSNLEADSTQLMQLLSDTSYVSEFGLDTNTILCAVIPDTYEFLWNTSADKAFRKIQKNYTHFWNDDRRQKAHRHGVTPVEATTIASIIEEETNKADDKPNIASVYLNRLQKGMKLQADPTVKYAVGDFTIRRIAGAMLNDPSPYNTYAHTGLPPGPICTPSPATIDAVLNAPETDYLFFCAKSDLSGASVFAATADEHMKNARAYQQALNERGIH